MANSPNEQRVKHAIDYRQSPINLRVLCACGWSTTFPRQNALARAAKVKAAVRKHLAEAR